MGALDRREQMARALRIGIPLIVLALLALAVWRFASDTTGERRPAPQVDVVALTPPPLPPPPPPQTKPVEKPPEPTKTVTVPTPSPAPPSPAPKAAGPSTNGPPKDLTMNSAPQAGADAFGVHAGSGGGVVVGGDSNGSDTPGGGGDFGAAAYASYLKAALQAKVEQDASVSHLAFDVQVRIWISRDGRISRVELARSSGDKGADRALITALTRIGRVDEAPPPHLELPARIELRGRRL